jgi:hypothetical protein
VGLVNQTGDIVSRIINLERYVEKIRKLAGNTSSIISRGGLTLLNNSFIKMVSAADVQILYIGPDGGGRQIIRIKRDSGADVLYTYDVAGVQYWALTDNASTVVVSDDAVAEQGLARPYIPLPHKVTDWNVLPKTSSASFVTLDEIRYYKQHPKVNMAIRHGASVGSTGEWQVLQDGVVKASGLIAAVLNVAFANFTVTGSHMAPLNLDVQARVTSGGGQVTACIREAGGVQT